MRIHTVSDLHVDYPENLDWVLSLSEDEYKDDVLILPGDVSDDIELLDQVLVSCLNTFQAVTFVPGNHELWVTRDAHNCSLKKFEDVLALCKQLGVYTEPMTVEGVTVVPMFSWYDFSFGEPDTYLLRAWRDFRACQWPKHLEHNESISEYFLSLNSSRLERRSEYVISFSHFLPRIDVMPSRIPEEKRMVYPVLGGEGLGEQVSQLNPDIHIYGHSHVNRDVVIDSIRYINNAFAYPSEQRIARKLLRCVYDDSHQNQLGEANAATY